MAVSDPQMAQMAADFFWVSDGLLNLRHSRIGDEAGVGGLCCECPLKKVSQPLEAR